MLVCLCVYTGTSGLVPLADAEEEEEEEGDTRPGGARSSCRRQWRLAQDTTCQQAGVCLAGILCPVDLDLSHPPLSRGNFAARRTCVGFLRGMDWRETQHSSCGYQDRLRSTTGTQRARFEIEWMDGRTGSALLIAIRMSELAFVWVASAGGANGAPVPSGPVQGDQAAAADEPREDEPTILENLPPDAANILADCFIGCFVLVVVLRLLAYRSRPTLPSRISSWWPAEWLAGPGANKRITPITL